ncbi:hypothetical protein [Paraburkholderia sp. RAU2J]|uniref:hypothetical protein n=1 Tax=Paraburkholderia sp. RAU2J TaxID=1938810 RepID=UPI001A7ECFEA|nr:hypothetical protein [Paraburkholderia sp. RAU2J]
MISMPILRTFGATVTPEFAAGSSAFAALVKSKARAKPVTHRSFIGFPSRRFVEWNIQWSHDVALLRAEKYQP